MPRITGSLKKKVLGASVGPASSAVMLLVPGQHASTAVPCVAAMATADGTEGPVPPSWEYRADAYFSGLAERTGCRRLSTGHSDRAQGQSGWLGQRCARRIRRSYRPV